MTPSVFVELLATLKLFNPITGHGWVLSFTRSLIGHCLSLPLFLPDASSLFAMLYLLSDCLCTDLVNDTFSLVK